VLEPEILIDDFDGTAHQIYGALPNMIYVIDADGYIQAMSIWNESDDFEEVLHKLQAGEEVGEYHTFGTPPLILTMRVLIRAGFRSLWDFVWQLPRLLFIHRKHL
jgi:hypothetical protein